MSALAGYRPQVKSDPPVRPDGKCWICKGDRKVEGAYKTDAELDPFCSTDCCRDYHGVSKETPISASPV